MTAKRQKYPQHKIERVRLLTHVEPKNLSQELYLEALRESTLTIGLGSAGSGKTFLAVYAALEKLFNKEVKKIVITRPIVEAGEELGFLPGTFEEKVAPYLVPIVDSLEDLIGVAMTKKLMDEKIIEVIPLAYMRGRSLRDCVAILDESQNCTIEQVKMFVTRIGEDSMFIVNGDPLQSDLHLRPGAESGLNWLARKLTGVDSSVSVIKFSRSDVVRSAALAMLLPHLESPDVRKTELVQDFMESRSLRCAGERVGISMN